jgi:DNA polymerase V
MPRKSEFSDGAPVGRDADAASAPVRRTSNAFGSPGADATVKRIDLNDELIRHPEATFQMRAAGDAMRGAGISNGDVLLVDRAITASSGAVVIAVVAGEMLCRRLEVAPGRRPGSPATSVQLCAEDGTTAPVVLSDASTLEVWGVVTTIIKTLAF